MRHLTMSTAIIIGLAMVLMCGSAWCQSTQNGWPTRQHEPPTKFGPLQPAKNSDSPQVKVAPTEQHTIQLKSKNIVEERFVSTHPESQEDTLGNDPLNEKLNARPNDSSDPIGSMGSIQSTRPFLKVVGGLTLVLAIFYALTIFAKRNGGNITGKVPDEVIQVLGQVPLDQRRRLQLVRLGSKILLLSVTTNSVETVGEIEDPVEVEHVISIMQRGRAVEDFQTFRRMTQQIRQQKRTQRMYPSQMNGEIEDENNPRGPSSNVFEA